MLNTAYNTRRHERGFTLVEIMVGLVIGLLGIVVMMQLLTISEEQKRSATSGDDAQSNGAIALYRLQRDMRQAGFGISAFGLLGCQLTLPTGPVISVAPVAINPAAAIVPAGDAGSDTLLLIYGSGNGAPQGSVIAGVAPAGGGMVYTLTGPVGSFAVNDYVIASPTTCAGLLADRVVAAAAATSTVTVAAGTAASTSLYGLGPTPKVLAYAVRNGNLTVCDYLLNNCGSAAGVTNPAIWTPVASNIVSLRAQYGRDTLTAPITYATPPTPLPNYRVDSYDQTTPATACAWVRAPAVRVALTARSGQYEKDIVTAAAPSWEGSTVVSGNTTGTNNPTAVAINVAANADWQHYRYRVFQTTVPLRNIAWMGVQSAC